MEFFKRRMATEAEMIQGEDEMKKEKDRLAKEAYEERLPRSDEPRGSFQEPGDRKAPDGVDSSAGVVQIHSMATPIQTPTPDQDEARDPGAQVAVHTGSQGDEMGLRMNPFHSVQKEREDRRWSPEDLGEIDALSGPLFNDEQVRRFEELQRAAPMLVGRMPDVFRPAWMTAEDRKYQEKEAEKEKKTFLEQEKFEVLERMRRMEEEVFRFQMASEDLRKSNQKLLTENQKLRMQIEARFENEKKPRPEEFKTPEEGIPEGEKIEGERGFQTPRREGLPGGSSSSPVDPKMMMKGMLKLMEGMQMMQSQILEVKKEKTMEVVKGAVSELPKLPDWKAETAPLDLTDWLLTIEPAMGDLSDGSQQWWEKVLGAARTWYAEHQEKTPLEKVNHRPRMPEELNEPRFQRLEKRSTALLMSAIPPTQQEEVIAGKEISTMAVLGRLMSSYQPGGLSEKAAILSALDAPEEAQGMAQAVVGLRKWLRWHRRAGEIGVVRPDATIQVKGLGRLMKKVLKDNTDLAFRIQLAKSTLAIDTTPTETTVMTYANHLLAEVEQVAHQDKKRSEKGAVPIPDPKIKKIEEGKGSPEGKGAGKGQPEGKPPGLICRYFISEYGCKKGKSCAFNHVLDDQKRCWNCGSTQHYAPKCERSKEPEKTSRPDGKGEGKQFRTFKKEEVPAKPEDHPDQTGGQNEVMKGLLEEANKMLRSMTAPKVEPRDGKLEKLQKQLDELKQLKVFRISRIEMGESEGLLDSGATHGLRARYRHEDLGKMKEIQVTLACGRRVPLRMTRGGTMVSEDPATEPIIPLGRLVSSLGCAVGWTHEKGMTVTHPTRGDLPTNEKGGCPHIPRVLALELIEELEKKSLEENFGEAEVKKIEEDLEAEETWLRNFVETHPVLAGLPDHVKEKLVVRPGSMFEKFPGANKRLRKRWKKRGVTLHLYSGRDEGLTLRRAVKEHGGDETLVIEVDNKNGQEWDMLEDSMYEKLMRMALDDIIDGVICGPNCRTRSRLRHRPIPGNPDAPRPVRDWQGGEWGSTHITEEEKKKVREDDVLMWRALMVLLVAIHVRRAHGEKGKEVKFLIEQPAEPEDLPEVVSWWRTQEWKDLKRIYKWEEMTFRQGDFGGKAPKPTTVGGDLLLEIDEDEREKTEKKKKRKEEDVRTSKDLERWAPGMMRMVAKELVVQIQGASPKMKVLSWDEHIQMNHTPFRRDCRVCQETRQKQNPHRRVGSPLAGVLSLDTAGPYRDGHDLVMKSRYLMVGAFTWLVPKSFTKLQEPEVMVEEGAPEVELWRDGRQKEDGEDRDAEDVRSPDKGPHDGERLEDEIAEDARSPGEGPQDGERPEDARSPEAGPHRGEQETEDKKEDWEIRVFRLAVPLATKKAEETLKAAVECVLRLRADGYHVVQIHTDQGHEYYGRFREWCDRRGIILTRTPGDDPQGNGRAEVAIQAITRQVRAALHQSEKGWEWWPMAARHVAETLRSHRIGRKVDFPPFMEEVLVRRRHWRRGVLMEPSTEKVRYICPAWDHHGHWVLKEDGTKVVTRYVIKKLMEPVTEATWIALEEETLDALNSRRRMREKVSPVFRKIEETPREEPERPQPEDPALVLRIIEEEMVALMHEGPENARDELRVLGGLKKMIEEKKDYDEILQTKIVSPYEVQKNWEEWRGAAAEEIRSLLEEKEALEKVSRAELEDLRRQRQEEGKKVEVIPSKVVFTRKPGPKGGKPKVRWVVCGNFETKRAEEDTFSSGADSTALRMMIHVAAQNQWRGGTLDVKTAFLNAEWKEEDEVMLVVKPPLIFTELGALEKDTFYLPRKAVYGFRRSPKLWGDCRDSVMEKLEVKMEDGNVLELKALESEPNLWKVQQKEKGIQQQPELRGLVMTYVDDMFFVGQEDVVAAVMSEMRKVWKTTEPEMVSGSPIRFLGMDVQVERNEESGLEEWVVSQTSYLRDLVSKEEIQERKIPISRDQVTELLTAEKEPQLEEVRGAQKVVGELLWMLTRTRPDLMFAMSKLCSSVLRSPRKVQEIAMQVKGYLKLTAEEGIRFVKNDAEEAMVLKVFTDASFAPDGGESHGCVLVKLGSSLISWKSGKQTMISLSTAEAELSEVVEGMALGEATAVMIEEACGGLVRVSYTDSQAALSIMTNEGGSWRTRHLRMRAMFARSLIQGGVWMIQHLRGERMLADVGTKPLASPRLNFLKEEMGMTKIKKKEGGEERPRRGGSIGSSEKEEMEKAVKLLMLVLQIAGAEAQEDEEEQDLTWFVIVTSLVMVFAAIGFVNSFCWCWRRCRERRTDPCEESLLDDDDENSENENEEGLRRRVIGSRSSQQNGRREERAMLEAEARKAMRGNRGEEPAQEPGTLMEDISMAVPVMEEPTHPEDWDPETHGDIPCGKGEPPAAYFQRMAEKGAKGARSDGWRPNPMKGKGKHYEEAGGVSFPGGAGGSSSQGGAGGSS